MEEQKIRSIRIPAKLLADLEVIAWHRNTTVNGLIVEMVKQLVEKTATDKAFIEFKCLIKSQEQVNENI